MVRVSDMSPASDYTIQVSTDNGDGERVAWGRKGGVRPRGCGGGGAVKRGIVTLSNLEEPYGLPLSRSTPSGATIVSGRGTKSDYRTRTNLRVNIRNNRLERNPLCGPTTKPTEIS